MRPTIDKEEFEKCLPVGISASSALFEQIEPSISDSADVIDDTILGEEGIRMLEDKTKTRLRSAWVRYVSLTAFLSVLRQLDLVLTPTGFGVISSDKYAPASKMRVDALEGQLRNSQIQAYARLIDALRSKEWGKSALALANLTWIYDEVSHFATPYAGRDYKEWNDIAKQLPMADLALRQRISDAQVDAVMDAYRCGDGKYVILSGALRRFYQIYVTYGATAALSNVLPSIYRILESDLDKYTEWAHSKEYDAYHHEGFKNTRDSSAYVFG